MNIYRSLAEKETEAAHMKQAKHTPGYMGGLIFVKLYYTCVPIRKRIYMHMDVDLPLGCTVCSYSYAIIQKYINWLPDIRSVNGPLV